MDNQRQSYQHQPIAQTDSRDGPKRGIHSPAFRESAPPQLLPFFTRRFGRMEPTGTYSLDFQRVAAAQLPVLPGARSAIAFLNTPTADPRWRLVEAVPGDELYVYFPVPDR